MLKSFPKKLKHDLHVQSNLFLFKKNTEWLIPSMSIDLIHQVLTNL